VITSAIAFDAQQVSSRLNGVYHCQIEEEAGAANLRTNIMAKDGQLAENLFLELGVWRPAGLGRHVQLPRLRVMQERLQRNHSRSTRF
jgi:hypothetical protein